MPPVVTETLPAIPPSPGALPANPGRVVRAIHAAAVNPLSQRLKTAWSLKGLPTKWTVVLSLICGVLTVLNQTTIFGVGLGTHGVLKLVITFGLAFFAFLHVGPIVGKKFQATLKLPPGIVTAISGTMLVGIFIANGQKDQTLAAVVIGAIQVLGGLGFEPAYVPTI